MSIKNESKAKVISSKSVRSRLKQKTMLHFFEKEKVKYNLDTNNNKNKLNKIIKDKMNENHKYNLVKNPSIQKHKKKSLSFSSIKKNKDNVDPEEKWSCPECNDINMSIMGFCEICQTKKEALNNNKIDVEMKISKIRLKDISDHNQEIQSLLKSLKISQETNKNGNGFITNIRRFIQDKDLEHNNNKYILIGKSKKKIVSFCLICEDDKKISICILESFKKKKGFGSNMVKQIIYNSNKKQSIFASSVLIQSKEFWKKMEFRPNTKDIESFMFDQISDDESVTERWLHSSIMDLSAEDQQKYYDYLKSDPSDKCLLSDTKESLKIVSKERYEEEWNLVLETKEILYDYVPRTKQEHSEFTN